MNRSKHYLTVLSRFQCSWILFILLACIFSSKAHARQTVIQKILIRPQPLEIELNTSGRTAVKVLQVEKNELIIAMKNARVENGIQIVGRKGSPIQRVQFENLQGDVLAVILTSHAPMKEVQSRFDVKGEKFIISIGKSVKAPPSPLAASVKPSEKKAEKTIEKRNVQASDAKPVKSDSPQPGKTTPPPSSGFQGPSSVKISEALKMSPVRDLDQAKAEQKEKNLYEAPVKVGKATVSIPQKRSTGEFRGDISDLFRILNVEDCNASQISNAVLLLKKGMEKEAFQALDQYVFQENFACREEVYFLRAYAFYRSIPSESNEQLIKASQLFQDALISYPKSGLVPFGYAAMGMIQKQLDNLSAAEGYFNIVKQGYLTYQGFPEILFHLAEIYEKKEYDEKALKYYRQVFEDSQENSYIADAGIGYGKALFKKRQYLDSLEVLNYVVQTSPKKVYDTSELLLSIGNANFEVGESRASRKALVRTLNLFPDIDGPDVILSRIGDTYGMENNPEKATKVYDLVREKYPDTEGYVASSIGIARYLKKDAEKIELYEMVKKKFPDNSYARIAMMRLAEIYQAQGEYNKCIKEIEDLLATHPRGLRYEAVKLMQRAYEALFKKQLKEDRYTRVLNRYELEHQRIDRMGSRGIAQSVGLAYLEAGLYDEAFNHLINAYKQYKRSQRSSQLLYGLGVAMDESGRKDDALKLFKAFSRRFPQDIHRGETLLRAGRIYLDKKEYQKSAGQFETAYKISKNNVEKGQVLMSHANVFEQKGDMDSAARLRRNAIKELALTSGENYDLLTNAYKELGRTYMVLRDFIRSADAYQKALNLSDDALEKANIGFLMGDAYQKGNIIKKAIDAFEQVVTTNDSIWSRMARQRLDLLSLSESVQNS